MINIADKGLVLDIPRDEAPAWLEHVVAAGRDAAFVDTGYLRALLDERDQRHSAVRAFHDGLTASLYTSAFVVAEAARQLSKADRVTQDWRWEHVDELGRILVAEERITICAPPEQVVRGALEDLCEMQRELLRLDLCDLISMQVLEALRHRRVLGFDDHFRAVGASLEP